MKNVSKLGLIALLAIGGVGVAGAARTVTRLPVPEHVTSETRTALGARMRQHGDTMSNLIRSVVLLDRSSIRVLASRIADEEVIARSGNAILEKRRMSLPPEFFTEQTVLAGAARDLAAAAADGTDDHVLAERFATLTRTCVNCHSVYLHGRPEPQPFGPPTK